MTDTLIYEAISIDDLGANGLYLWTGEYDLTRSINGVDTVFMGLGSIISVGGLNLTQGQQNQRLVISLKVGDDVALFNELLNDPGPLLVKVEWLYSHDGGQTIQKVPREFFGSFSDPKIQDRIYVVELETIKGDVDRANVRYWSHEDQQMRDSTDTCFSRCAQYAQGIEHRWPS